MKTITRKELKSFTEEKNVAVVEVLSEDYYRNFHLPNAINVPLGEGFDEQIQQELPDKERPVVVYCYDKDCAASLKAAKAMDHLGYENVYDYEAGKADWREAGLPVES